MEKNLDWLNEKWWYRLLKVFYVFTLLGLSIFAIAISVDEFEPYEIIDRDTSEFRCTDGNYKTYTFKELGSNISSFQLRTGDVYPNTVASLCDIPNAYGEDVDSVDTMDLKNLRRNIENEELVEAWRNDIKDSFVIDIEYETEGSWLYVLFSSLAWIIGVFLFLEIIKRIFYYVVLGKIRPKR